MNRFAKDDNPAWDAWVFKEEETVPEALLMERRVLNGCLLVGAVGIIILLAVATNSGSQLADFNIATVR